MLNTPRTFEEWYIKSAYQDFVRLEDAPLYEGSALENLATLPLADWKRRGGNEARGSGTLQFANRGNSARRRTEARASYV